MYRRENMPDHNVHISDKSCSVGLGEVPCPAFHLHAGQFSSLYLVEHHLFSLKHNLQRFFEGDGDVAVITANLVPANRIDERIDLSRRRDLQKLEVSTGVFFPHRNKTKPVSSLVGVGVQILFTTPGPSNSARTRCPFSFPDI
jgi:hypothetical protein